MNIWYITINIDCHYYHFSFDDISDDDTLRRRQRATIHTAEVMYCSPRCYADAVITSPLLRIIEYYEPLLHYYAIDAAMLAIT